jgi:peptidoglycan/xylan/chitin deacetylase (PgdA/CDA1 family)
MVPFFRFIFPSVIWRMKNLPGCVYLTFDDGPVPEVTPWVLETLNKYNAKATFFCVGENAERYPHLLHEIKKEGHSVGNHTMRHLNGWNTATEKYLDDVQACKKIIESVLFRPPYGKMKWSQYKRLRKEFKIVMWDVLSMDYRQDLKGEDCFGLIKSKATSGSVIVFHDSLKAEKRLRFALPETLSYFSKKGYSFSSIQPDYH